MHDGDKLGKAAVGELVRTKNKREVNPFHAGKALVKKVHDQAVHFSYGSRYVLLLCVVVLQKLFVLSLI